MALSFIQTSAAGGRQALVPSKAYCAFLHSLSHVAQTGHKRICEKGTGRPL